MHRSRYHFFLHVCNSERQCCHYIYQITFIVTSPTARVPWWVKSLGACSRHCRIQLTLGMGTETRYLIGLGAKLWNTGVSISSDVNGSVIGTGEIKKTHIHLLLLYLHIILQILSHQSHQLFLYRFILKHLSMMHFCYSQFRSEIALMRRSLSARNMKAV